MSKQAQTYYELNWGLQQSEKGNIRSGYNIHVKMEKDYKLHKKL